MSEELDNLPTSLFSTSSESLDDETDSPQSPESFSDDKQNIIGYNNNDFLLKSPLLAKEFTMPDSVEGRYCKRCRHFIRASGDLIRCQGPCQCAFHLRCSGLVSEAWMALEDDPNALWYCDECASSLDGQLWIKRNK